MQPFFASRLPRRYRVNVNALGMIRDYAIVWLAWIKVLDKVVFCIPFPYYFSRMGINFNNTVPPKLAIFGDKFRVTSKRDSLLRGGYFPRHGENIAIFELNYVVVLNIGVGIYIYTPQYFTIGRYFFYTTR